MTPPLLLPRVLSRSRTLAVFDAEHYGAANADLREVDPLEHFARHGLWERRPTITPERRLAGLAELCALSRAPPRPSVAVTAFALRGALGLAVRLRLPQAASSRTMEAAEQLAKALREVGAQVQTSKVGAASTLDVFVDPLRTPVDPAADPALMQEIARGVVLLSGPPSAPAFPEHLPHALLSAGVMAFSPETHALLAATGVPALWLAPPPPEPPADPPAGWEAVLQGLGPPPLHWADRPFDIAAFGALSERRIPSWFVLAEPVARRRAFVHIPRPRPDLEPQSDIELRRYVFARSRIALHLQRDGPAVPDWRTLCDAALRAGALLVSEPGLPHPRLDPELHYFEEAPRRMPALIDWLLDTPEGRYEAERRRLAARSAMLEGDDLVDTGVRAAAFLLARRGLR